MRQLVSRAAVAAVTAVLLGVGTMATPALAAKQGRYEAIMGHFGSRAKAEAAKASALKKGWPKVVIQVIAADNVEVELSNGEQTKADADRTCAKAKKMGIHCYSEKEGHGIPKGW